MGACAQVGELALLVEADDGVFGQVVDELYLVRLVLHQLQRFRTGQLEPFQLQLFLADLPHLRFDLGQDLRREGSGGVDVIVKAVVNGGADGQLHIGIETLDRLGENVGTGVPVSLAILFVFKGVLIVSHDTFPPYIS